MTYSLKSLKSGANSTEKLLKAIDKSTSKGFQKDDRYWELSVDKAGNGFATIRFLQEPFVDGEDGVPYVQYWKHSFKGPTGQWYIENSLSTLNQQDPVGEYNSKLWATGIESNKNIARAQKRQLKFVSNIRVIKDVVNPENEGKVFLFAYGKEIFEMVQERLPELKDEEKIYDPDFLFFNPFNFWTGANFKLAAHNKDSGFRSYSKSTFLAPSPISTDEKEIERIWKESYSLKEIVDPKNFKPYADLKARLDRVLGITSSDDAASSAADAVAAEVNDAVAAGPDDSELEVFRKLAIGD